MNRHLLTRVFAGRPVAVVLAAGLALALVVGALDYLTGVELSLSIFYLLPIALVVWYGPRWAGFSLSVVSTAIWLVADAATGHTYSHWLIFVENAVVRLGFFVITASLLATVRTHLRREQLLARTDGLTQVLNGWAFTEICETLLQLAARHRHPLALAYIDIDDFKTINDSEGHSAGDAVLQAVAATLTRSIRSSDLVGRLGGDEFAVLMPETGRHGAQAAFGKISRTLRQDAEERGWAVGFSIGVAIFRTAPASVDDALKAADRLMYRVKQEGKNNVLYEEQPINSAGGGEGPQPYSQPGTSEQRVMRALSGR
jgi:diguanylate cyclase (GGDEF)-like protein